MARINLIKVRNGIKSLWTSQAPVLAAGEPGYDSTNCILKVGDGSQTFDNLPAAVPYVGYNYIINPAFEINQRGVASINTNTYVVDMVKLGLQNLTVTASQQSFSAGQTDVPGNPSKYIRCVVASGSATTDVCFLMHKIEDVNTLAGQVATLSFYAKANATKKIAIETTQAFGPGGSTTTNTYFTQVTISSTWTKYTIQITVPSISGKTLGTVHYLQINMWMCSGSDFNSRNGSLGEQSGTFEFANVKLEAGSVATPFRVPTYAEELRRCMRYFVRFSAASSVYTNFGIGYTTSTTRLLAYKDFPVQMRVPPTITSSAASTFAAGAQLTSITFTTITPFNFCSDCGATWSAAALPYLLYANNTTSAYIDCSAEL